MGCDFGIPDIEALKNYNLFCFQRGSIEGEGHLYGAIGFIRRKCGLGSYFFFICQHRLAGGLVHEGSLNGILLAYSEVLIFHRIHNGCGCGEGQFLFAIFAGGLRPDLRLGKGNGLVLVLDVRMDGNLSTVVIEAFKDNHALTFQRDGVEGEGHRDGAIRRLSGEGGFRRDGLAVHLNHFARGLVHELPF